MEKLLEQLCGLLAEICQSEEVRNNPDVRLFDKGLLDSFGVVELLVALENKLDIQVPLSEFDREEWATPRQIAAKLEGFQ
jgi:D-alanine--poly(phosphoribitol) ligase subunit 2